MAYNPFYGQDSADFHPLGIFKKAGLYVSPQDAQSFKSGGGPGSKGPGREPLTGDRVQTGSGLTYTPGGTMGNGSGGLTYTPIGSTPAATTPTTTPVTTPAAAPRQTFQQRIQQWKTNPQGTGQGFGEMMQAPKANIPQGSQKWKSLISSALSR